MKGRGLTLEGERRWREGVSFWKGEGCRFRGVYYLLGVISSTLYLSTGQRYPSWMQGELPDVKDGEVTREVRFAGVTAQLEIRVKNCGE